MILFDKSEVKENVKFADKERVIKSNHLIWFSETAGRRKNTVLEKRTDPAMELKRKTKSQQ